MPAHGEVPTKASSSRSVSPPECATGIGDRVDAAINSKKAKHTK